MWLTIAHSGIPTTTSVGKNRPEKSRGYHCNVHITAAYYDTTGSVIGIPNDATAEPGHEWPRAMLLPQLFHDPC